MTDSLIRTAARRPLHALARPSVVAAFAIVLAYGGGLWLNLLHIAEGGYERNEPPLILHWLRDATLALPLVLVAVWAGVLLARRLIERTGCSSRLVSAMTLGACVAVLAAIAGALGGPAHAAVFGATHGGHELPLPLHLVRDGLLALVADLPLAALVAFGLRSSDPWAPPRVNHWLRPAGPGQTALVKVALGFIVIAPAAIFLQSAGTELATADAAPAPCAPSSPVKHFDVSAIDVDIPLNKFGDHDPQGKMYVLDSELDRVRAEEHSRQVTRGLRNDAIQPLVIRANQGDCVEIRFTNQSSGGEYGLHIDGLAFDLDSSGDAIGNNPSSAVGRGGTRTYKFWVPREPETEGAHYMRPGPGYRQAVAHGLFGVLVAEPPGSTYRNMDTGDEQKSGWEASIVPGNGKKAFREYVQLYHEIGDEDFRIKTKDGGDLPTVDPHTTGYRPGSRAINYRSEPFMNRLDRYPEGDGVGYSSYPFGDPSTPMPRSYLGDPTKMRIVHAGTEMFHVFHMHGGGIRWRYNPQADQSFDYGDTGLNKHPKALSASARLDSQSIGPGEAYNMEIEGGAGGVQQGAGEFLFHCHIAEHYVGGGMWGFWRVYDTNQPDLRPLPDRAELPGPIDSTQLIGRTMPDGTTLTANNIDDWIRPQLPPQGAPKDNEDDQVWDWQIQQSGNGPLYLGEPEDKESWPGNAAGDGIHELPGHPGLFPVDQPVGPQDRPKILFNPTNGRPAFPLLRLHVGKLNPFAPNGHSGAPYLGETANKDKEGAVDPWAKRPDGICPDTSPVRRFNVVGLELPIKVTGKATDPFGKIWVLAKDVPDVLAGRKPAEPLAIRSNIGDCVAVTEVSEMTDAGAAGGRSRISMHIHHVQFDTQSSDGPVTGESFQQSIRPFRAEDPQLTAAATVGQRTLQLASAAKFHPGSWIAVGMGLETIEVRQIDGIDSANNTVSLNKALNHDHASGEYAGTEFVQTRWYPDVNLDNIFWHDHVDGIHTWGHGLVGQLIVEPKDATYHDPQTGAQVDSGTYVDIHTNQAIAPGQVDGSFRELALWTIDTNPVTDSTLNLRAEPWSDRGGDPSTLFSSWTNGDPVTPVPMAYRGDPFVLRTINVGDAMDTFHIDGHRFRWDPRFTDTTGKADAMPIDTLHYGISEKFSAILEGGAGGVSQRAGDYLMYNGIGRRFRQGAWGILRVLPRQVAGLQPLPGTNVPAGGVLPTATGGRPPAAGGPGDPCPADAGQRSFDVTSVAIGGGGGGGNKAGVNARSAFVPTSDANAVRNGTKQPEPLVLHVAAGECMTVRFTNGLGERSSFHVPKLDSDIASSGVNVGFNPEQTVAPGQSRTYRFYADTAKLGSATISDFGGQDTGKSGLYGAVVVAPRNAEFTDPETGGGKDAGTAIDVHVPGGESYRDFTTILADTETQIGANFMPYPTAVKDAVSINYLSPGRRNDDATMFSSRAHGDPAKGLILRAYGGDPVRVHAIGAPGSEQVHDFNLGGQSFAIDPNLAHSEEYSTRAVGPWESLDIAIAGGAGGRARSVGDYYYGDVRRPFTEAGMWGLMRVMSDPGCPIKPLPGLSCLAQPSLIGDLANLVVPGASTPVPGKGSGGNQSNSGKRRAAPSVLNLSIRRRMSLKQVHRNGIKLKATVPSTTRRVRVRMYRLVTTGKGKKRKTRKVRVGEYVKTYTKIKKGGRITVTWKSKTTRRLKAGSYLIQVDAGPKRGSFFPGGAQVEVQIVAPRRR